MKNVYYILSILATTLVFISCGPDRADRTGTADTADSLEEAIENRLLVFSKTDGFRHDSIEHGIQAIQATARDRGVHVEATEDASIFNPDDLSLYDAVLFLNTTQEIFDDEQRDAFQNFIRNGGGFAGVHAAADTEYDWPWYGELVGAWFESHPPVLEATVRVVNPDHLATRMLPEEWTKTDEWYNFQEIPDHVEVLLELDTDSFEGSEHPGNHPISWFHEFEGGRAFYTGLGHTVESWSDDLFMDHLWGGIDYVMDRWIEETGEPL